MKVEIDEELVVRGVALAAERLLLGEALVERVADAICQRFELVDAAAAAALLDVTPKTLAERHADWGLDKSLAFGATNPRYFVSQVLARAREKVLKGRSPAVPGEIRLSGRAAA
jgi:hypothetical protein